MKYLLPLLFVGINVAQGQYALRLNLKKGNTYYMHMQGNVQCNTETDGKKETMQGTLNGLARFDVAQVSDTAYVLDLSFDSMYVTVRTPMGKFEFSSDPSLVTGEGDPSGKPRLSVTLLPNGGVKKIRTADTAGFAGALRHWPMFEQMQRMMRMGQMGMGMGRMRQGPGGRQMKESLEKITAIFPDKKVALNEEWGYTLPPDSVSNHTVKTVYRLVAYSGGKATIRGNSSSKTSHSKGGRGNGFPGNMDMNSTSEMNFVVDAATGWIQAGDMKRELIGQIQYNDASKGIHTTHVQLLMTGTLTGK